MSAQQSSKMQRRQRCFAAASNGISRCQFAAEPSSSERLALKFIDENQMFRGIQQC
jgi:hypothetical protein